MSSTGPLETPLTITGNVVSDGVGLSVDVPPDNKNFTVTAKVNGQQASASYVTKTNQDGSSTFERGEIKFNQEKSLIPIVNNKNKGYPRLMKAIEAHGGLCDIMCNHIVMEDLISEEKKAATPYKMARGGAKKAVTDFNKPETIEKVTKGEIEHQLSAHEEALLNKLEKDVAKLHFLKQVTIFQIFKAALFDKIPHNHLSSDEQGQLNKATKKFAQEGSEKKDAYLKIANDILKLTDKVHEEERFLKSDEESLKILKSKTTMPDGKPFTKEDLEAKEKIVAESEKGLERKRKSIEDTKTQIENLKKQLEPATGEMNKLLSNAVDNIEPGKYAKFMSYEKDGIAFSGHTMLIRNNGDGKYSFFDPDKGLRSNVDKAELMVILDKAFLECDRPNLVVIDVHKMLPPLQELKKGSAKEAAPQQPQKENPLFLGAARQVTSHFENKNKKGGFFAGIRDRANTNPLDMSKVEKSDEKSTRKMSH